MQKFVLIWCEEPSITLIWRVSRLVNFSVFWVAALLRNPISIILSLIITVAHHFAVPARVSVSAPPKKRKSVSSHNIYVDRGETQLLKFTPFKLFRQRSRDVWNFSPQVHLGFSAAIKVLRWRCFRYRVIYYYCEEALVEQVNLLS